MEKALRCLYRTAESIKSNDEKAEGGCLRLLSMNLRDRVDFDGCGLLSFLPPRRDGADEWERLARNPAVDASVGGNRPMPERHSVCSPEEASLTTRGITANAFAVRSAFQDKKKQQKN